MTNTPTPTPIYDYLTPQQQVETQDGIVRSGWVVAVDPVADKSIYDYQLVLSPAEGGDGFAVFRSATDMIIPEDAAIIILGPPGQVLFGNYQYNLLYGQLVRESHITDVDSEYYISMPAEIQGKTIPQTPCLDEELWRLICSSLVVNQNQDDTTSAGGLLKRVAKRISSSWE